jgi:hypothetical protein
VVLISTLLLLAPGCSDDPTTPSELCIEFDESRPAIAGTVSSRLGEDSICEVVVVEIVATDIDDVFGFATKITYDRDVALFSHGDTLGSILESGNTNLALRVEEQVAGEITIGVTRVSTTGVDVVGTEVLIRLFFEIWAIESDSGTFTLEDECLLDSGEPPVPKAGIDCGGGTLRVR